MASATVLRRISLQPTSLRDEIVSVLQRAILSGSYRPGERLVERQLAVELGVSAIPVREALMELEARGLVTRTPNRGCHVTVLSPADLEQIFKLRNYLEPKVVEWAGENVTPEQIDDLQRQLDLSRRAAEARDIPEFFYQDLIFHRMVWALSGNRYAARALEMALGPFFAYGLMRDNRSEEIDLVAEIAKHQGIVDAMRRGEPKAAAAMLAEICRGFEEHIRHGIRR
jgi:DNA-binding GntR family transcriptional regulator